MQYKHNISFAIFLFVCSISFQVNAQQIITENHSLVWMTETGTFQDAFETNNAPLRPLFASRFALPSYGRIAVELFDIETAPAQVSAEIAQTLSSDFMIRADVEMERRKAYGKYTFVPYRKTNSGVEKLVSFQANITFIPSSLPSVNRNNTTLSALASGDIYKIEVGINGVHKIDYDFLKNLGVDVDNINPKNIQLLGNGGGKLPEPIATPRIDDLAENAIFIQGENDNSFDPDDYILFYAEEADKTYFDELKNIFRKEKNIYDDKNYYFIKIGSTTGKRIQTIATSGTPTYTTSTFDDFQQLEEEKFNLLYGFEYTSGGGQQWLGDRFGITSTRTYNFNFPNLDITQPIHYLVEMAGRKNGNPFSSSDYSYFTTTIDGQQATSTGIRATYTTNVEAKYAYTGISEQSINVSSGNLSTTITYNAAGADGWLDYIIINGRSRLNFDGNQIIFRDRESLAHSTTQFDITGTILNLEIWDITDIANVGKMTTTLSGNTSSFTANTSELKTFIAFDNANTFPSPTPLAQIEHQNLHAIAEADAIFLYHDNFLAAAQRLATHRTNHSGMNVVLVDIDQLYNEFSSGSRDALAIRDFAKMLYDRSPNFKYLLLFGDGSFDHKNNNSLTNNDNFIPVYESAESFDPINSFPTDDYYALLSNNEGDDLVGALDIATGRLPIRTALDAEKVVDKIIHYDTSPNTLGDWRNNLTFLGDDEDSNIHVNQADEISTEVGDAYKNFNVNKIFFDAYNQVSSAGGDTYPGVKAAINNAIFKGQLVVNYLGHGGPTSWAQERVLQETDVNSWTNKDKMPLFVTATCSFGPYDDPTRVSIGEQIGLREDGGAIALFTTVRAVYSSSNKRLTEATFNHLFEKVDGEYPTLGEILRLAKNSNSADTLSLNARKFTLLGDPTLQLAMPELGVATQSINGQALSATDTIKALEQVTITGYIKDDNGNINSNFNGTIYPTVYDKFQTITTLANDAGSLPKDFQVQKNIIFKGAASVVNGEFTFSFYVPKDIDYQYGIGRISYYAHNAVSLDASDNYEGFTIGGTSDNPIQDDTPPLVDVFMDDDNFAFGGITNDNPIILAKISDDFGINVSGAGIGHDLTAVIDEQTQNTILLNDFYEAEVDDYKKGSLTYPLFDLEPGLHTLRIKAWDIANNSGEGYTEFLVADDAEIALDHVLNYPNPFTTRTEFQFEHNLAGQMVKVLVRIYSISGKLVKTIEEEVFAEGSRMTGIVWDGNDEYGDKLARGVYVYKIDLGALSDGNVNNSTSSSFQKLVILR